MDMSWAEMAAWYDQKQGDDGDLWHRTLIDPPLFQLLGAVDGQRVLDLGCGNGYIARRLAWHGARVTGVDASAPIIERARARENRDSLGVIYHVGDAAQLDMLADQSFDAVVSNMALMDIADAAGAIHEVGRVLRRPGRLVASLSHPCFDVVNASAWAIERMDFTTTIWRKVSRYRELIAGTFHWNSPNGMVTTPGYHRPLSWYVRALRAAGLALTAFEEPEPTPEFLANSTQGSWIAEIPLHCVIEARTL